MSDIEDSPVEHLVPYVRVGCGATVGLVGATVLVVGWFGGVDGVTRIHPSLESMKANTAVGFILLGVLTGASGSLRWRSAGRAAAIALLALSGATIVQYVSGVDLGIDQFLVDDVDPTGSPGRMGLNTAAAFALLATGRLLRTTTDRLATVEQALVFAAAFLSFLAFAGYAFSVSSVRGLGSATEMALHTSIAMLVACVGLAAATSDRGPLAVVHTRSSGGVVVRRLIPPLVGLLLLTELSAQVLERNGIIDSLELVVAYTTTVGASIVFVLVMALAWRLDRRDRAVREAERRAEQHRQELVELNRRLETRVRERTRDLELANQELNRSNRELEQFAYVASHDLKEPLRMVSSFVQRLSERYGEQLDERGRDYADFAVEGAQRMRDLIDSILLYSRAGRVELESRRVDLDVVVQRALDLLGTRVTETGAEVEVTGPLPSVPGDDTMLTQVLANLVGNSLRFVDEGVAPHVRIASTETDDLIDVLVDDNGIGIPEEYRDRVFDVFSRLHSRTRFTGTGIGLAIVERIVERHHGAVRIEDSPLGGTRFRISLPRSPAVHASATQEDP